MIGDGLEVRIDRVFDRVPTWVWVVVFVLFFGLVLYLILFTTTFRCMANANPTGTDRWFAEGNTLPEFETYYCIKKSTSGQANVHFEFQLEDGSTLSSSVPVAAYSRCTVALKALIPSGHTGVAARVRSEQLVVVERSMYFDYKGKWTGGSTSSGQASLQKSFYFAEGTTRSNQTDGEFETWLCLQNPNEAPASINITYLLDNGADVVRNHAVAPRSRFTLDIATDIGNNRDCGVVVTSSLPIACERPMYYDYHGEVEDGSTVVGAPSPATQWYFAEGTTRPGFDEWLTLMNPSDQQAQVTVRYVLAGGGGLNPQVAFVAPRSRRTINVNLEVGSGLDISTIVESDVPVVAERSMYADGSSGCYGGESSMGTSPATYCEFAEGSTLTGFTTYYTVINPGSTPTSATITYQFQDGYQQQRTLILPVDSRMTINLSADVGEGRDVAASINADKPVVAERPMYFDGRWHGSTTGSGTME